MHICVEANIHFCESAVRHMQGTGNGSADLRLGQPTIILSPWACYVSSTIKLLELYRRLVRSNV